MIFTRDELRRAFLEVRLPHWPTSLDEQPEDSVRASLVRLRATLIALGRVQPGRPLHRRFGGSAAARSSAYGGSGSGRMTIERLDLKRRAAGERDDD
jgi:hypothetical protein